MTEATKIKAIITGATGMVGQGVLLECLESDNVTEVLVISRKPIQMEHPKLKEIIHKDFLDLSSISQELKGYNACFFCLGISSMGLNEAEYSKITYEITRHFAEVLHKQNPNLVFNFVSGTGSDSSEKGKVMWARVKGKAENVVLNQGFGDAYAFRPGIILPMKGVKSAAGLTNAFYTVARPFFPLLRNLRSVTNTVNIGKAMINSMSFPQELKHIENKSINELARK